MSKEVRDVSAFLQKVRQFLLGRKHTLHGRFPPFLAPRTLPPADVPRCPDYKYSNQYYYERNAFQSVQPPIVAPIAEGPPMKKGCGPLKPDSICFNTPPTPGSPWWWDGHFYYECVEDPPKPAAKAENVPTCPTEK